MILKLISIRINCNLILVIYIELKMILNACVEGKEAWVDSCKVYRSSLEVRL